MLGSEQFFGSTNDRHFVTASGHDRREFLHDRCVGNVLAIPGQKHVHPVDCGEGDVDSVACRSRRQESRFHDLLRYVVDIVCQVQQRKILEEGPPPSRGIFVATRSLFEDDLRDTEFVVLTLIGLPVVRELLPCSLKEIATRSGGQIARDRRFDVDALRHEFRPIVGAVIYRHSDRLGHLPTRVCS